MGYLESIIKEPSPDFNQLRRVIKREGKPDYVPLYELFVDIPVMEELLEKKIKCKKDQVEFYYKAGYDYVPIWPRYKMDLGSLTDTSKPYPIIDWDSFEDYRWPKPNEIDYREIDESSRVLPEGMMLIGQDGGPFEMMQSLLGYENLCILLYDDPALIGAIAGKIREHYLTMYNNMVANENVGAIVISDDLGYKTQTLINVEDIRKYFIPIYKDICKAAHQAEKPCILHSCGQIYKLIDDLIDYVGIDAKHSYEDTILPVEQAYELYSGRWAILGGIDVNMLCSEEDEYIIKRIRNLIYNIGSRGSYAVGSGNSIATYVPISKYLLILDEAWKAR